MPEKEKKFKTTEKDETQFPKGKGKKPDMEWKSKDKPKDKDKPGKKDASKKYPQDPFWYAKDAKALDDMATLPWNEIFGSEVDLSVHSRGTNKPAFPGIAVVSYCPALGRQDKDVNNYATRAAANYFNDYTQGFTSSVDFEAPDIMFTAIAGANLISMMKLGERTYGLLKYYIQKNPYYAKPLVQALNFDFDDWSANMANFRTEFNIRVEQINKLIAVPKDFNLLARWNFLNTHLFCDSTSTDYSQIYCFVPRYYLTYESVYETTGTSIRMNRVGTTLTVAKYFEMIDTMIAKMTDEDVRKMFGALRRVYSSSDLYVLEELDKDYLAPVSYHEVMLMQLHNMNWTNVSYNIKFPNTGIAAQHEAHDDSWAFQDGGDICSLPVAPTTSQPGQLGLLAMSHQILDLFDGAINPGNTLDCTALKMTLGKSSKTYNTKVQGYAIYCRTEIITGFTMVNMTNSFEIDQFYVIPSDPTDGTWAQRAFSTESRLTKLNYCPLRYGLTGAGSMDAKNVEYILGEIDTYTIISDSDIQKMHARCFYTLLNMPQYSKSTT